MTEHLTSNMSILNTLRAFLYDREIKKFRSTNLHKAGPQHYDHIESVGILFDATPLEVRDIVLEFAAELKKSHKRVKMLAFINKRIEDATFPFEYFGRNDLTFAQVPKKKNAMLFMHEPFDLLVNLDHLHQRPLTYVSAASRAVFKIGTTGGNTAHYDLMIDMNGTFDLSKCIREIRETFNRIE